jgi:hypothetical protein
MAILAQMVMMVHMVTQAQMVPMVIMARAALILQAYSGAHRGRLLLLDPAVDTVLNADLGEVLS